MLFFFFLAIQTEGVRIKHTHRSYRHFFAAAITIYFLKKSIFSPPLHHTCWMEPSLFISPACLIPLPLYKPINPFSIKSEERLAPPQSEAHPQKVYFPNPACNSIHNPSARTTSFYSHTIEQHALWQCPPRRMIHDLRMNPITLDFALITHFRPQRTYDRNWHPILSSFNSPLFFVSRFQSRKKEGSKNLPDWCDLIRLAAVQTRVEHPHAAERGSTAPHLLILADRAILFQCLYNTLLSPPTA